MATAGGDCLGAEHGDGVARGYVTVDSVRRCTVLFPSSPGYFTGGEESVADDRNVLWGDYFIFDQETGNLNHPIGRFSEDGFVLAQSHVTVLHRIPGLATGQAATRLVSACESSSPFIGYEWPIPFFD